jgi:hypothetical protein
MFVECALLLAAEDISVVGVTFPAEDDTRRVPASSDAPGTSSPALAFMDADDTPDFNGEEATDLNEGPIEL